jgi:hypothetical protein
MTDEHGVLEVQCVADLRQVVGIAVKRRILGLVVGR